MGNLWSSDTNWISPVNLWEGDATLLYKAACEALGKNNCELLSTTRDPVEWWAYIPNLSCPLHLTEFLRFSTVFKMTLEYQTAYKTAFYALGSKCLSPISSHCPLPCHLSSRHMPISDLFTCSAYSDHRESASVFSFSTKFNLYFYCTSEK